MKKLFTVSFILLSACGVFAQGRTLPYLSKFESAPERAGWQEYRTGFVSHHGWSMVSALSHDYNVGGNPTDTVVDWMVSPPMNFKTAGMISFKILNGGFSSPTDDNCQVWYSTGSPDPVKGNYVLIGNISKMEPAGTWKDTMIAVPTADDSGYIAFRYKTIGAAWRTYAIDSVRISDNSSTGIGTINIAKARVYPNPVRERAVLEFSEEMKHAELHVFSIAGQLVKVITNISGKELIFDRTGLLAGTYLMELKQDGRLVPAGKLIIAD